MGKASSLNRNKISVVVKDNHKINICRKVLSMYKTNRVASYLKIIIYRCKFKYEKVEEIFQNLLKFIFVNFNNWHEIPIFYCIF